ncbi:SpoIIIAH-like family protein [Bacillus subtilis]|uniref:SpoIIIAH-like family protein n=1 Tax=Bacillus subtilis TaxID=1423 RepID=UPI003EBE9FD3
MPYLLQSLHLMHPLRFVLRTVPRQVQRLGHKQVDKGTEKGADEKSTDKETNGKQEDIETSGEEGKAVSEQTDDELFTTYRLELEDKRSKQREEFNEIVSSDDATAQEKSEAYDQMTALSEAEGTERQLETLIKTKGYKDALVSAEGDKVSITVRSDKKSKSQAADIIDIGQDDHRQQALDGQRLRRPG